MMAASYLIGSFTMGLTRFPGRHPESYVIERVFRSIRL